MSSTFGSVIAVASVRERAASSDWRETIASLEGGPALLPYGQQGLQTASRSDHDWIWVLDGETRPRRDALSILLAVANGGAGRGTPGIVAGIVVDESGVPVKALLAAGREHDTARVLELAQRRIMPIRHASLANTLVHRDALAAHGHPRPDLGSYAHLEWTARIARDSDGLFVPASAAIAPEALRKREAGRSAADVAAAMRMYRTGTWTRGEAARAAARLLRP